MLTHQQEPAKIRNPKTI